MRDPVVLTWRMFTLTKTLHLLTAFTSISFFAVRAVWMLQESLRLSERWVRVAPHVVDTVLFITGVALVVQTDRWPLPGWLVAKLTALVVYVVLGSLALRRAPTRDLRIASLVGALVAFCVVVMVALTRFAL